MHDRYGRECRLGLKGAAAYPLGVQKDHALKFNMPDPSFPQQMISREAPIHKTKSTGHADFGVFRQIFSNVYRGP